ncbi:hypothetical protein [Pseudorhizobium pelagicum]|uniref:hypothetical protein n=1 Tax=Pseudorhizobium pelagicum TaxID=1509405 RepID=UPI00068E919B|nr:hypothetical protein [Pseudorhizobium pelagicum]
MDLTQVNEVMGLASSAVGLTGKAAGTIQAIKALFDSGNPGQSGEAGKLINALAAELTAANIMNVQLSEGLRALSQELRRLDEFETEKARYEIFHTRQNDVVFRLKAEVANGEREHFICPVCLNRDRLISFLQGTGDYRRCQTDNNHVFQFADTPLPSRGGGNWMA